MHYVVKGHGAKRDGFVRPNLTFMPRVHKQLPPKAAPQMTITNPTSRAVLSKRADLLLSLSRYRSFAAHMQTMKIREMT